MKKYVFLINNIVHEIIDEYVDVFPTVPIQQRYSIEFLNKCLVYEENETLPIIGYVYDAVTGEFSPPPVIEPVPIEAVDPEINTELADAYEAIANLYEMNLSLQARLEALENGV